jgi:small subunit ribosomal protein S5
VLSKVYGSNNPVNVVKAAFQALSEMTSLSEMARRRDMTPHELAARRSRRAPASEEAAV